MKNILRNICDDKKKDIENSKNKCSLKSLIKLLPEKKNRNFKNELIKSNRNKKNSIIAEIKKCSPSAGEIIKNYFPDNIAIQYEKSGASSISILTESSYFKGHLDHLSLINRKVSFFLTSNVPKNSESITLFENELI